ncbi:methionine--tRNA ligase [Striga asiatica]|uniref:Methionine--tRNA ligase n=1 Tax=Striga asiatica TaxID=4170 RepID=A0A5A7PTK5_STRAF|nr:methionine--tRNA ligase [Striga asiatica]
MESYSINGFSPSGRDPGLEIEPISISSEEINETGPIFSSPFHVSTFFSLLRWSPSMEVKTSPPTNIKTVMKINWESEKTSISTVDMLETVAAETDVKSKSMSRGAKFGDLGFKDFRTPKPKKGREIKLCTETDMGMERI